MIRKMLFFISLLVVVSFGLSSSSRFKRPTDNRHDAIVRLCRPGPEAHCFCSATIISDTLIVTAAHCLGGLDPGAFPIIDIRGNDNKSLNVIAMPLGSNPRGDVAVLYGDFSTFKKVQLSRRAGRTMELFLDNKRETKSCGYPWMAELVCVSITEKRFAWSDGLQAMGIIASGWLFPGMSGGPVLDTATGELLGVNTGADSKGVFLSPIVGIQAMFNLKENQL